MKQKIKTSVVLASGTFLGLLGGQTAWVAAGILGLATLAFIPTLPLPLLARVRVPSRKGRS